MSNKIYHALGFLEWAKKMLPEETYAEINKKAGPAAGGIAKKLKAEATARLEKAFIETPNNYKGLGHDSTLAVVASKGKFAQDDVDYRDKDFFGDRACGS